LTTEIRAFPVLNPGMFARTGAYQALQHAHDNDQRDTARELVAATRGPAHVATGML